MLVLIAFETSEHKAELEPESMIEELPSYLLVPVHWFQATSRDCPNSAKSKFKVVVIVTSVLLWKDLGTRVPMAIIAPPGVDLPALQSY